MYSDLPRQLRAFENGNLSNLSGRYFDTSNIKNGGFVGYCIYCYIPDDLNEREIQHLHV